MLLKELEDKAPSIWRNQRDTEETFQRLRTCVSLLGPEEAVASIRTKQLDDLKTALWALPRVKSPNTINRYLAAISKALRWAAKRDLIAQMPYVPREPGEPFRLVYFTEDEEAALLRYFLDRGETNIATALRVLSLTGLRISELLALKPADVDMGSIHVRNSKNKRDRFVPLQSPLDRALIDAVRLGLPSYFKFNRAFLVAKNATGVDTKKGFHVFRHTCATRLTRLGVPTAVVKDLLGHRSLATTLKYAHVEDATLRAAASLLYEASPTLTAVMAGRDTTSNQCAALH